MSGPEDNPADDEPVDRDEWEAWEKRQLEYGENYIAPERKEMEADNE